MENNKDVFEYTYYAPSEDEKKQIQSIRQQYLEPQRKSESKFDRLKKLNAKVKKTATYFALIAGIIGCLVFGLGLTMVLEWSLFVWGIIVMLIGSVAMALAYPLYNFLLAKGRKKYGEEILSLSKDLLEE